MQKFDENRSDNSLNKSVARSSSGVSTQQSVDGIDNNKEADCQIVFGNCFSKFPHPEVKNDKLKRSSIGDDVHDKCSIIDDVETVERNSTVKSDRRHSEAQSRSFGKLKYSTSKRKNGPDPSGATEVCITSSNIDRLLNTLSSLQENRSPSFYNEIDNTFFRNPSIPMPQGERQLPVHSSMMTHPPHWSSFEEALASRADSNPKELFFALLDSAGKVPAANTLTYFKLYQRAQRVCAHITSKLTGPIPSATGLNLRPGQAAGIVFRGPEDAMDFVVAFFACVLAKVIAVPLEKPCISQSPAGAAIAGKYTTQLNIKVILTNIETHRELSRKSADVKELPPWNGMLWVPIDNCYNEKLSRSFSSPEPCSTFEAPLYLELVFRDADASLRGLPVSQSAALQHCQALEEQLQQQHSRGSAGDGGGSEVGRSMLCTEDVRNHSGLWHSLLLSLYSGVCCYYLPFSYVKKSPITWLSCIFKLKVDSAVTDSRVLHQVLSVDQKQLQHLSLAHLNSLIVTDASVPWITDILERAEARLGSSLGLPRQAVLLSTSRPETLSICLSRRRPEHAIRLCLESLSYGLIRDLGSGSGVQDDMSITVHPCGPLLPGLSAVVVNMKEHNKLCRREELGEICVDGSFAERIFWMTPEETSVELLQASVELVAGQGDQKEKQVFTRTGLVGFFRKIDGVEQLYVYGTLPNFVEVAGRMLNCDDIIGTVSAVNPHNILFKGRCSVFTVPVLQQEHLVIGLEVDPSVASAARIYDWLGSVLQAVLQLHKVPPYCVFCLPPHSLPARVLGGHVSEVSPSETRSRFLRASLPLRQLVLCPRSALSSLLPALSAPSRALHAGVSVLAHAVRAGALAAQAGPTGPTDPADQSEARIMPLPEVLEWRAAHTPTQPLLSILGPKMNVLEQLTCEQLHRKAEKMAALIKEKTRPYFVLGSVVTVFVTSPLELLCGVYGCYYAGVTPLVISLPNRESPDFSLAVRESLWAVRNSQSIACLVNSQLAKMLKSKEVSLIAPVDQWGLLLDQADASRRRGGVSSTSGGAVSGHGVGQPDRDLALCLLDRGGQSLMLPGWSHSAVSALCQAHKAANRLQPGTDVSLCFFQTAAATTTSCSSSTASAVFLTCLASVYCGYHAQMPSPAIMETAPDAWLEMVAARKIKYNFCSEACLYRLTSALKDTQYLTPSKKVPIDLQHVQAFVVCARGRPCQAVVREFLAVAEKHRFELQTLSVAIESGLTPGCFVQIPPKSYPRSIYLDRISLRNNRIQESQDPSSLEVIEAGLPLSESITVFVVEPESRCQRAVNQLGELWLAPPSIANQSVAPLRILAAATRTHTDQLHRSTTAPGRQSVSVPDTSSVLDAAALGVLHSDKLGATLQMGESTDREYLRTGLMGFLRTFGPDQHLVVMGTREEMLLLRGFTYFPAEIEQVFLSIDDRLVQNCVVFAESELLVAVLELNPSAVSMASTENLTELCLRMLPRLVRHVLEQCLVPPSILQFVRPGQLQPHDWLDRRMVHALWTLRRLDSVLQFYCL